jgi:hypothetical protein
MRRSLRTTYEWVPPHDYRVREMWLLDDAASLGQVAPDSDRAMRGSTRRMREPRVGLRGNQVANER